MNVIWDLSISTWYHLWIAFIRLKFEWIWRAQTPIMSNITWASISKRMLYDCLNYILKDCVQVDSKRVFSLCYCFYQNKFHKFVPDFHNPSKRWLCWFLYHIKNVLTKLKHSIKISFYVNWNILFKFAQKNFNFMWCLVSGCKI